jgi:hypothetical protein
VAALSLCAGTAAHAGPDSEIASSFDEDDSFDLHVTLDYGYEIHRASIHRELVGLSGTDPGDPMPVVRDLRYASSRHVLTPRLELGIFHDLAIQVGLPIVIFDQRSLEFDQSGTPCEYDVDRTCVDATNSTTVGDGILPPTGFDARDPQGPGFVDPSESMIFRGPNRKGLDQLHLGVVWAPMNQARDDTKPTWKIGAELRLPIGGEMKFDRDDPDSETSVGSGRLDLRFWTSISKRIGWAEPYVELWWIAPLSYASDSAFEDPGYGSDRWQAQQHAGTHFGFEAIALDRPVDKQRVSLDFSGKLEANFEGRGRSEMWEVFAFAGAATGGGPLVLDENPTQGGLQAISHPGVTSIENHLKMGGKIAVRGELGDKVRIAASFEVMRTQSHIITFADAGVDLPECEAGESDGCEDDNNDVVNPGTEEVNPAHVPLIDLVGHRYRVGGVMDYIAGVEARVLF